MAVLVLAVTSCVSDYSVEQMQDLGPPTASLDDPDLRPIDADGPSGAVDPDAPTSLAEAWSAALLEAIASHLAPADRTVTVLVPTEDAFADVTPDRAAAVLADPAGVDALVESHLLRSDLPFETVIAMPTVTTRRGDELVVESSGMTLAIGGASVVDVSVTTGVDGESPAYVFVSIDRVLLTPP
jgi:uncharacterized surface protein with fasciclin (FAS1) repeats